MRTGIYRHYAGEFYLVLFLGQHTERDEVLVTYVPLTGNAHRAGLRVRHRPLTGVKGFLNPEVIDGKPVPRFTYVGDEMPEPVGEVVG